MGVLGVIKKRVSPQFRHGRGEVSGHYERGWGKLKSKESPGQAVLFLRLWLRKAFFYLLMIE